jgi:hypothetical protein
VVGAVPTGAGQSMPVSGVIPDGPFLRARAHSRGGAGCADACGQGHPPAHAPAFSLPGPPGCAWPPSAAAVLAQPAARAAGLPPRPRTPDINSPRHRAARRRMTKVRCALLRNTHPQNKNPHVFCWRDNPLFASSSAADRMNGVRSPRKRFVQNFTSYLRRGARSCCVRYGFTSIAESQERP